MTVIKATAQIPSGHFFGGAKLTANEELRDVLNRMKTHALVAGGVTVAAMTALVANDRHANMRVVITASGLEYYWHATSALTADGILVVAADDAPTLGRFLLAPGQEALLSLPFTFALADAAALLTVPAGAILLPRDFWWTISADFTGGTASAIGVSTDVTGWETKGDLLGGAAGDVAADLEAADSPTWGTIGAVWDTVPERRLFVPATKIIRYDEITSAFTAGAGTVEMLARIVANAGA